MPLIRANNCGRYSIANPNLYIIYPYTLIEGVTSLIPITTLQDKYPNTYIYLKNRQSALEKRKDSRSTFENSSNWYSLTRFGQFDVFKKEEKIVFPGEQNHTKFGLDYSGSGYSGARVFSIVITDNRINVKTLLAILNSSLIEFYIHSGFPLKQGGYYSMSSTLVEKMPIRIPDSQSELVLLVDEIINLKQENSKTDTTALEKKVDRFVYDLYELTDDEINTVEAFKKTV